MMQNHSSDITTQEPGARARATAQRWALALLLAVGAGALPQPSHAQSGRLDGSWSGGGAVSFATGSKEQARCRAHYSRRSSNSYTVRAVCATPSARAEQTANVRKIAENRYRGNFYNREYDVSGIIDVVVRGNSQSVRLTSSAGWAALRLSR